MALTQMRVEVGGDARIDIYLISDGRVVVVPGYGFTQLYEHNKEGISALFDSKGFTLYESLEDEGQHYDYETPYPYKDMPVFKAWLMQQNLQWPV